MKKVKQNRAEKERSSEAGSGRVAQRNRTRRAIVDAAKRLMTSGATPSMAEIAAAAEVSRRTMYMYFPTLEQLLIDATLGALSQNTIDPVIAESDSKDPVERVEQLSRAMNRHSGETMHLGRALIRLTVEGDEPQSGGPRRGYRRV
jgi:AcrR family transcriptional regulator